MRKIAKSQNRRIPRFFNTSDEFFCFFSLLSSFLTYFALLPCQKIKPKDTHDTRILSFLRSSELNVSTFQKCHILCIYLPRTFPCKFRFHSSDFPFTALSERARFSSTVRNSRTSLFSSSRRRWPFPLFLSFSLALSASYLALGPPSRSVSSLLRSEDHVA